MNTHALTKKIDYPFSMIHERSHPWPEATIIERNNLVLIITLPGLINKEHFSLQDTIPGISHTYTKTLREKYILRYNFLFIRLIYENKKKGKYVMIHSSARDSITVQTEQVLIEKYDRLYRLAYSYVYNEDDALYIVQEIACKAICQSNSL